MKESLRARREEEKAERRSEILDAAEKVIAKRGWEQTNYGEIAKISRLSRSLVYFYFPTRDHLFHAVCERGMSKLEQRFAEVVMEPANGLDQAMALGAAYWEFSKTEPLYFDVLSHYQAREVSDNGNSGEAAADEHGQRCLGYLVRALALGLEDGSVRPEIGDPRRATIAIWACTHGLILMSDRKEPMLQKDFGITSAQTIEHGFQLLRGSLAAR